MKKEEDSGRVVILRNHRLKHLPEIRVSEDFFEQRFSGSCSMMHCNAACCRYGVMADPTEMERILKHAELIKKYMEPHQEHDSRQWFEDGQESDADYPSGAAVGTQYREYGCVFLDSAGRCVLQTAATEEGMDKFALKPFFCVAYPVTLEHGVLDVDDPEFTSGRTQCCAMVEEGQQTILDVCVEELRFMLGEEGVKELRKQERPRA